MKKRISKITSILLVILLAVTAVSLVACGSDSDAAPKNNASDSGDPSPADNNGEEPTQAAAGTKVIDTDEEDGVKYELYDDGTLIISGEGYAKFDKRSWEDRVTKVIGEEGITGMGISDCKNLTEVVIPGSVQVISPGIISDCPNLTKISIGEGATRIEKFSFQFMENLAEVELPDTIIAPKGSYAESFALEHNILYKEG